MSRAHTTQVSPGSAPILLPAPFPILRARVTLLLLEPTPLPPFKGGLLRGGFGYAFQRSTCPQHCWDTSERCTFMGFCPFHRIFDPPHPPGIAHLHDLRDVPRAYVFEPPDDQRTIYQAGDTLEFGLVLIGSGIDDLGYFVAGFEQLGQIGIGRELGTARLERVEVLCPWQPAGPMIYQDGRMKSPMGILPLTTSCCGSRRRCE